MPDLVPPATTRLNPHAPPHWFVPDATYMITAATYQKAPLLNTDEKRDYFLHVVGRHFAELGWRLLAWAVLANHYHVVAIAPQDDVDLSRLMRRLHARAGRALNHVDRTPGRKVWYQYWDSCITHETSLWARLHYVHDNPVHHGLVGDARNYPWCSMRWFLQAADEETAQRVQLAPYGKLHVVDDF